MKKIAFLFLLIAAFAVCADIGDPVTARSIKLNQAEKIVLWQNGKSNCVIVVPPKSTGVAKFAAGELQKFLQLSSGTKIPIVNAEVPGKVAIYVGSGADVSKLQREAFVIKGAGKKIVIAGKDHPTHIPCGRRTAWSELFDRATIFGVYDFLERFIGARFVFPGKYGTVIPKHKTLSVPSMDITDRPDNIARDVSWTHGDWYEEGVSAKEVRNRQRVNNYRMRLQSDYIPNCHGLSRMAYIERFGKTNPEYFALRANGTRSNSLEEKMGGQLCFSSAITEEIYQDAKAFLLKKPAASRGIRHARYRNHAIWDSNAAKGEYFNIMPQDGMVPCLCEKCKALAAKDKDWNSNQVWKLTIDSANRLKKENVPGYLTQMAYGKMCTIPPYDIPDNVLLMVAVTGPWQQLQPGGWSNSVKLIEDWIKKRNGRKVWLWTYTIKRLGRNIPDAPCGTPRAVGKFYSEVKDHSFGSFMESECDRAILQMFNWYVFSKLMWNKDLDLEELLRDTYQALYGAGAEDMDKFFSVFEYIWLKKINGNVIMTDYGPVSLQPTDFVLWNEVYNAEAFAKLEKHLADAKRKAAKDKEALERINFIGEEYLGKLKKTYQRFCEQQKSRGKLAKEIKLVADNSVNLDGKLDEAIWKTADTLYLRGLNNAPTEVSTEVKLLRDSKNLYVAYNCEEPAMDKIHAPKLADDDFNVWQSTSAEFYINPDGTRKNYFQFIASVAGNLTDFAYTFKNGKLSGNIKWNSGAQVKVDKKKDSWTMEIAIPLAKLGKFDPENIAADFARNRILKGRAKGTRLYIWSPYARKYHDYINFGVLSFNPIKDNNMLVNGTFKDCQLKGRVIAVPDANGKMPKGGLWFANSQDVPPKDDLIKLDKKEFLFDGQSLRIDNPKGKSVFVAQYLPKVEVNKKYRVTFSLKSKVVKPGTYSFITVNVTVGKKRISLLKPAVRGDSEWTTYSAEFTPDESYLTNKVCCLRLYSYKFFGTVWFDGLRIEEVKE